MPTKSFIKAAVYRTAHVSGLSRALGARYRGRGIIFALHSVVPDDTVHPDRTLRCPVGKLEWILRRLEAAGVDFVTLEEAVCRLSLPPSRPFAAFTFDDGFADNITHALPVMEKYAAPFTLYVTTGMVTRDIDGWWFGLGALIRAQDRISLPGLGTFACADAAGKARTFAAIEAAVHNNFDVLPAVRDAISSAGIDIGALVDREALTEHSCASWRTIRSRPSGRTRRRTSIWRAPTPRRRARRWTRTAGFWKASSPSRSTISPIRSAISAPAANARRRFPVRSAFAPP